ncbi:hypothetical protein ALO68_101802 [Pseudomonas syringae pv. helianthi]|uniref:Uncharacterized protein n=2 Tax=Pseudomonas syringae group genomosp. 7 TaxID=251699 RepID=A0A0P9RTJ4_9PSED|nr:hypothetical protein ALO68_101802 [Pseudomonas syringae pv. helianthi]KPY89913.1 hypothetical protein ALO44_101668 [Pseudomonas syringae pv. tagetis]RMR02622.1 hypothetical protein ALP93_101319 [Pseudomonas syringae pv. helianthi]RMV46138.1 hypothetical protein ALP10_101540 [Pseudomonas syringae pv. helianthi]RMW12491.1 hypothetical protein ALO98_101393 [Pseudomonas syringae pv. tagetis]
MFVPVYPGVAGHGHVRLSGGRGRILAICEDKSAITGARIDRCPQSVVRMFTEGCPSGVL